MRRNRPNSTSVNLWIYSPSHFSWDHTWIKFWFFILFLYQRLLPSPLPSGPPTSPAHGGWAWTVELQRKEQEMDFQVFDLLPNNHLWSSDKSLSLPAIIYKVTAHVDHCPLLQKEELRTREVKWLVQWHGVSRSVAEPAPSSPLLLTPLPHHGLPILIQKACSDLSAYRHRTLDPVLLSRAVGWLARSLSCAPWLQGGSSDGARSGPLPDRSPSAAYYIITHALSSLIAPASPKWQSWIH